MADPQILYAVASVVIAALVMWVIVVLVRAPNFALPPWPVKPADPQPFRPDGHMSDTTETHDEKKVEDVESK